MNKTLILSSLFLASIAHAIPPFDGTAGDGWHMLAGMYTTALPVNNPVYNGSPGDGWGACSFSAKNPILTIVNAPSSLAAGADSNGITVRLTDGENNPLAAPSGVSIGLASNSSNYQFGSPWGISSVWLSQGASDVTFYYCDYAAGNHTLTVSAPEYSWKNSQASLDIYPGPIDHFAVAHDGYGAALQPEVITATAYDSYNNVKMDYTGTALFSSGGATTLSPSSHTYTAGNLGVYSFQLTGTKVETVQVNAVDSVNGAATGTSAPLAVNGPYISAITSVNPSAVQGARDSTLMRFDIKSSSNAPFFTGIRVDRTGSSVDADIERVKVYLDNGDRAFSTADDVCIGSAPFSAGRATIAIPTQALGLAAKTYFVGADIAPTAVEGHTIGAQIAAGSYITVSNGYVYCGNNNLPFSCTLSTVTLPSHTLIVTSSDTAPASFTQAQRNVCLLTLTAAADASAVVWNALRLNKRGSCSNSDVAGIALWCDDLDQGYFDVLNARLVSSGTLTNGAVNLGFTEPVTVSTRTYYVTGDISLAATVSATFGVESIDTSFFGVNEPNIVSAAPFPIRSSTGAITPTIDVLTVTPANVAPAEVLQGSATVRLLKLTMAVNQNATVWSGLRLDRIGTGADSDIAAVKILTEDGTLISAGDDVIVSGSANVFLSPAQTIVAGEPKTYYVVCDIAPQATLDATVGLRINATHYCTLSLPDYTANTNFPMSAQTTVREYPDVVVVVSSGVAPATVDQNQQNVCLLRMKLSTGLSDAAWSALHLVRFGTASDSDVAAVKVYRDANGNDMYDQNDSIISSGSDVFSTNAADIALTAQTINTSTKTYFVVVNISPSAAPNASIGVRLAGVGAFTVALPNTVSSAGLPFDTALTRVNEPPSLITVQAASIAPGFLTQGDFAAGMVRMKLWTDRYTAAWRTLRLNLAGTAVDTDVASVRVYKDDGNGIYDSGTDQLISSGNDQFTLSNVTIYFSAAETITTSTQTYFVAINVSETAVGGNTCGINLASSGFFGVDAPDAAGSAGLPFTSATPAIQATVDTLSVSAVDFGRTSATQADLDKVVETFTLRTDAHQAVLNTVKLRRTGTASDADFAGVKIYRDENGNGTFESGTDTLITPVRQFSGGTATMPLITPEVLSAVAKKYLIAVDYSQTALPGVLAGIAADDTSYFSITGPDVVSPAGFPWQSTQALIYDQPDTITAAATNRAGATIDQGKTNAVLLRLLLKTDHDAAAVTSLRVTKQGTLDESRVQAVKIFADSNASGAFEVYSDVLVGSGTFTGNSATINFAAQAIQSTAHTYFIACDIDIAAEVGATLGVGVPDAAAFTVTSPDTMSSANLPCASSLATVRDIRTPLAPVIIDEGQYTANFREIRASWTSSVIDGTITEYQYGVGTSTAAPDVLGWTTNGTNTAVDILSVLLENAKTYYVFAKAKSSYGLWSDPGVSDGITADLVQPVIPGEPAITSDNQGYIVSWPICLAGVSGVAIYELEERTGDNPRWAAVAGLPAPARGAAALKASSATRHVFTGKLSDTYYYRVRAKNGAGVWSAYTEAVRLVFGQLPDDIISSVSSYPNPFDSRRQKATIHYILNRDTDIELTIYTLFGARVRALKFTQGGDGGQAGSNEITWDGKDDNGDAVPAGGYIGSLISTMKGTGDTKKFKIAIIH